MEVQFQISRPTQGVSLSVSNIMPLYCDFCGGCFTGAQWLCANCPALYCSGRCKSSDSKEHSRVCSLQNGGDAIGIASFSRAQATFVPQQRESFNTERSERSGQSRPGYDNHGGQENKFYHSRTFYSSRYSQSHLEGNFRNYPGYGTYNNTKGQPTFRRFESNVVRNNNLNNNDGAEKNQQQVRGDRSVHFKSSNLVPPPAGPVHQIQPTATPQESKQSSSQVLKDPAVNVIPPAVPVKIPPTAKVVLQESKPKPQVRKDPTVVPRNKTQNLYELLKTSEISTDEESEEEELLTLSETVPAGKGFVQQRKTDCS